MIDAAIRGCAAPDANAGGACSADVRAKARASRGRPRPLDTTMNRTVGNRLFLLLALAHFLTDAGFAGAVVLCVGPNDHRAIESQHTLDAGCRSELSGVPSLQDVPGLSATDPLSSDCVDSPLHSEAELISSKTQGGDAPPAVAIVPTGLRPCVGRISHVRPRARAPDETAAHRAVRTTVLII